MILSYSNYTISYHHTIIVMIEVYGIYGLYINDMKRVSRLLCGGVCITKSYTQQTQVSSVSHNLVTQRKHHPVIL